MENNNEDLKGKSNINAEQKSNINAEQKPLYSKENFYYKREKRKNILLLIIIFILLIYVWFCFTYHWGIIKSSGDATKKENTIGTSGEADITENEYNDNSNKTEGPYYITDKDKNNFIAENSKDASNTENNNQNTNISNNESNNIINDVPVNNLTPEEIEKIKLIQTENETEFKELDNLDIFKNFEYNESKLIYPGLSGSYNFNVENYSSKDIKYKLTFACNNPQNVNMKYKLKRNGVYISGNNDTYVSIEEIKKEGLDLKSMMGDIYILEWKWVDDDVNDINSANSIKRGDYTLTIKGEV